MTDFNQPAGATPTTASATAVAAQAAASLIHSASQINELSGFSSLAQYGSQFPLAADHTTAALYGTSSASFLPSAATGGGGLDLGAATAASPTPVSSTTSATGLSASPGGISSFGFTQEQVACVCEVLEQSQNIDRLAR